MLPLTPFKLFSLVALASPFAKGAYAHKATDSLVISNVVVSPDGKNRSAVLAGGVFPGPLITANKGQILRVNVTNQLTDPTMYRSTSVHWHGLFQKSRNWADGASWVSQCPIIPDNSFLYEVKTGQQAGTFWYHSHISTQYCDGLRGPLVVYDPFDPHRFLYDIDDESTVITLADWYHTPAPSALVPGSIPPTAETTLINGKGRFVGGPPVPLSVINVERGKRYRFRIVAMVCDPNYTFSIDGHSLTVIEADGENTVPLKVDSVQIFAAQRYSVVLHANQPVGNYWIRSLPNLGRGPPGFDGGVNSAILRYAGAPDADPVSELKPSKRPLRETDLHPLDAADAHAPGLPFPGGADVTLNFEMALDPKAFHLTMNNQAFTSPPVPVLLQILNGANAKDLLPAGDIIPLPRNKVIEISMPGSVPELGAPHPFHLHGHAFSVVRSTNSTKYNYVNPIKRDTVDTGFQGDNVTIRFTTDNTGPWFLHCHIEWHLELGLGVIFAEDMPRTVKEDPPPDAWKELCPKYNALKPDALSIQIIPPTAPPTPPAPIPTEGP